MKKLSRIVLQENVSVTDLVNKKAQRYIFGGFGSSGSYWICCRYDGDIGCAHEFNAGSCEGHESTCREHSTAEFYTCVKNPGS
jgi:hypothetical protein